MNASTPLPTFKLIRNRPGNMRVILENGSQISCIWHDMAYCSYPRAVRPSAYSPVYKKTRVIKKNAALHLLRTVSHKKTVELMVISPTGKNISHEFHGESGGVIPYATIENIFDILRQLS